MEDSVLLLNIIIDNSSSMKGEKIEKLKMAIEEFDSKIKSQGIENLLQYSITIFQGFYSMRVKKFEDSLEISQIKAEGLPFVNLSIRNGINNLISKVEEFKTNGIKSFKPWTVLLLNGDNYGSIDKSVDLIMENLNNKTMSYFPFALTDCEFDASLSTLRKIKPFTIIKDCMYSNLFTWIFDFAYKRVTTPIDQPLSIDPKGFEGWTIK